MIWLCFSSHLLKTLAAGCEKFTTMDWYASPTHEMSFFVGNSADSILPLI
jgi:cytochrome P450